MTKGETYYHLYSATMDPCSMVNDEYEKARLTWLCVGCMTPKNIAVPIDAQIEEKLPADPPLNFINGCGLGLVRASFLAALGPAVISRDLLIGRLLGPDGALVDDWVTFRGRYRVLVRGSKNISYRRCTDCGRHVYFAMGKRYLYPQPPDDAEVFESDLLGLVVRGDVFSRLALATWPKIQLDKLGVPTAPKDSLGPLL